MNPLWTARAHHEARSPSPAAPRVMAGARPINIGRAFSVSSALVGEGLERRDGAVLRVVLDELAADELVDGREGGGVHVGAHVLALLVAAELVHGDAVGGELLHLLLHRLAELAPGSVHDDHRLLARLDESVDVGGGLERLDRLARVPQVAVKGLLGALDVDAALGLGRAVLVDQPDEAAQPLARVAAPLTLVALELPVDELGDALALALGLG